MDTTPCTPLLLLNRTDIRLAYVIHTLLLPCSHDPPYRAGSTAQCHPISCFIDTYRLASLICNTCTAPCTCPGSAGITQDQAESGRLNTWTPDMSWSPGTCGGHLHPTRPASAPYPASTRGEDCCSPALSATAAGKGQNAAELPAVRCDKCVTPSMASAKCLMQRNSSPCWHFTDHTC